MTGLVRKATLLGVCGLFAATTAFAASPSPGNSTVPDWIGIVGTAAGVPDPNGHTVSITVRDFSNNPIAGQAVELDFSACTDARVCQAVVAGAWTPNCSVANGKVTATTDAAGQISLVVLGATNNSGAPPQPGAGGPCVAVTAGVTLLKTVSFYALDQNGTLAGGNGVTGTDLSIGQADFLNAPPVGPYVTRTDYDQSGTLTGTDLSLHQGQFLLGGSTSGCHDGVSAIGYCP